jgi:uncharacterized protein (TIGR02271 family)
VCGCSTESRDFIDEEAMTAKHTTVVGVFHDQSKAQAAVRALKERGFTDNEIGVLTPGDNNMAIDQATGSRIGEGSIIGAVGGAGVGALWALGLMAGVLPAIGPVVAGGVLMSLLASAGGAAVVGTIIGALAGLGIPEDDAAYYETEFRSGRTLVTVQAGTRAPEAWGILQQFGASRRSTDTATPSTASSAASGGTHYTATSSAAHTGTSHTAGTSQTVRLHEEHLKAEKTPVQTGEVRVHKEVHTTQQTIQVPVTREEVVVERRPVSGSASTTSASDIKPGQEIRIPVREERVHVTKETVPTEEVSVGKRQVTENQEVSGTVRKEEVRVEREGDVEVRKHDRK